MKSLLIPFRIERFQSMILRIGASSTYIVPNVENGESNGEQRAKARYNSLDKRACHFFEREPRNDCCSRTIRTHVRDGGNECAVRAAYRRRRRSIVCGALHRRHPRQPRPMRLTRAALRRPDTSCQVLKTVSRATWADSIGASRNRQLHGR